MSWRTIAVVYLLAQGAGAIAWWCAIVNWPEARPHLVAGSMPLKQFQIFLPADAILFIGGSFLSALAIWQRRKWAALCLAIHAGAAWYASAYAWTASISTGTAWPSALLMIGPLGILPLLVWHVARDER